VPKGTPVTEEFPDLALPHSLHLPARLYQPTQQFASESFYDFDVDSSNYSVLAGDPPEVDEGSWVWKDTNDVTLLAENVAAQASEQTRTFWSGVLLGVAGAGLITVALEVVGAFQARAETAADLDPSAGTGGQAEPDGSAVPLARPRRRGRSGVSDDGAAGY
jgi:hypothetical protein